MLKSFEILKNTKASVLVYNRFYSVYASVLFHNRCSEVQKSMCNTKLCISFPLCGVTIPVLANDVAVAIPVLACDLAVIILVLASDVVTIASVDVKI
ncbi:hypothetical protein DM860_010130 [Cuscuta australis]|uniref:Uncharacterized protein n=1 Tax=Cuscuta australis TaxID=267555 RepID=A0A328D714_9ASTE|nr:hypothetical protein DM860_010130 [Cuscuta australis]